MIRSCSATDGLYLSKTWDLIRSINDIAVTWAPGAAPLVIAVYTTRTDATTPGENRIAADIARVVAGELP